MSAARAARLAAGLLGAEVAEARPLHGGDLSEVVRLRMADGRRAVAKTGATARAEAEMLEAIAAAGAPAPAVLAVAHDLLVLEDLGDETGLSGAWEALGRVLATLHADTGDAYGWPRDHAFGPVAIPNAATDTWPAFWAERRLLPSVPHLPAPLARRVEMLAARLPDLLPERPPAALLHGDLWTGNVMARGARLLGLIDPACYRGHAEVDLAMLHLFGRPGPAFHVAYGQPEPGEDTRRPIYTLWPALVHLRLFGPGYRGLVERCLDAARG
ncbi:aminoglycoside phosphotransferase [Rhodovulum sp. 12E13]|uniref:fructosamine kinase family protein n=1 Tax=Rhodovulum sp. 12E13 TaxID=2203891 RepID=UPI000E133DAF|nr:fructosamine kinase family protein [Rhodovulum sp. 12E13]RDC75488.1 aminoglycoside phosphotransferase [Rhodovulum sp. 12E13]